MPEGDFRELTVVGGPGLRRRRGIVLALAGGPLLATGKLASAASAASGAADAQVRVIGPWEISSLDPLRNGYLFSRMQVTETLVEYRQGQGYAPGLAAAWTVSPDRLTWQFRLQNDARFHDGTPVRARDVAAALARARHAAGMLAQAPIDRIVADDGERPFVALRLTRPFSPLPALLSHASTQVLAPASFGADGSVRRIIGSGPYRIVELGPPQRFSVAAFEGWRGNPAAIGRGAYLSVGRAEMRALMMEAGQAELAFGLDPGSIARLARNRALKVHAITIPRTTSLKVNTAHPFLADLRVRQALSYALDRRGIATAILRDPGLAASQLFPPSLDAWHDDTLVPLTHDPARARQLLAAAGWQPGTDGVLRRGGERFALTLRTFPDRPELPVIAAAIQEQFRLTGIALRVLVGNSSDIPFGHRDGTLELGLVARNYGVVPDAFGAVSQDFASQGGDWGAMHWSSAPVVSALAGLAAAPEGGNARVLRQRVAQVLQDELPMIPVVWYRQTLAASARLKGVSIDPFERSYRLTDLEWT